MKAVCCNDLDHIAKVPLREGTVYMGSPTNATGAGRLGLGGGTMCAPMA